MKTLLVSANRTDINMRTIPLGLCCVASATSESGHEVRIVDLLDVDEPAPTLTRAIQEFDPGVIGVSLRNIDDQNMRCPRGFVDEAREIIAGIKRLSSAPVVLGGAGYSMFPEALLLSTGADMGIQGEGEKVFPLLLDRLERKGPLTGIPGLYISGAGLQGPRTDTEDLDLFPLPDSRLMALNTGMFPIQTRRGCPFGCSYCSTGLIEGTKLRRRSPDRVVEWISSLAAGGIRQLYFVDNTFNLPPSYALELSRKISAAALEVSWWCILYPLGLEETLISTMARAGCTEVSLGFESGCERILSAMGKRFTRKDVEKANGLLHAHGIRRMGFLLLGGPGETRESIEESLEFADSLDLDSLKITIGIRIYPHTPLAEQAREEGMISRGDDLLTPRFYMVPGLEDRVRERVMAYAKGHPACMIDT